MSLKTLVKPSCWSPIILLEPPKWVMEPPNRKFWRSPEPLKSATSSPYLSTLKKVFVQDRTEHRSMNLIFFLEAFFPWNTSLRAPGAHTRTSREEGRDFWYCSFHLLLTFLKPSNLPLMKPGHPEGRLLLVWWFLWSNETKKNSSRIYDTMKPSKWILVPSQWLLNPTYLTLATPGGLTKAMTIRNLSMCHETHSVNP